MVSTELISRITCINKWQCRLGHVIEIQDNYELILYNIPFEIIKSDALYTTVGGI